MRGKFQSGGRYPVLRTIAILYLIGAFVVAIAGGIFALFLLVHGWQQVSTMGDRVFAACGTLAATALACLTLLAISEVLKLFMDIERNSRTAALRDGNGAVTSVMTDASGMTVVERPAHINRIAALDEETAEGALMRGH